MISIDDVLKAAATPADETILPENLSVVPVLSPALLSLIGICLANPVLCEACLAWAHRKKAETARAELVALYGPERVDAMEVKFKEETAKSETE